MSGCMQTYLISCLLCLVSIWWLWRWQWWGWWRNRSVAECVCGDSLGEIWCWTDTDFTVVRFLNKGCVACKVSLAAFSHTNATVWYNMLDIIGKFSLVFLPPHAYHNTFSHKYCNIPLPVGFLFLSLHIHHTLSAAHLRSPICTLIGHPVLLWILSYKWFRY